VFNVEYRMEYKIWKKKKYIKYIIWKIKYILLYIIYKIILYLFKKTYLFKIIIIIYI
jgi:hypothetical protein